MVIQIVTLYVFRSSHIALFGQEAIYRDDKCVGYLRRGDYAYALNKPLGCGYVVTPDGETITSQYLTSGSYSIECMGTLYPAEIHLKSPFDPKNQRIKGVY
jgi:sarcosine dehydrogenase